MAKKKKKIYNKEVLYKKYTLYKMVEVNCFCKKCRKAFEFTGWELHDAHELARFEHKCPKCKKVLMLMKRYPVLEYPYMCDDDTKKELGV